MCWHFSLRTYSIDATTALWICFLLLHKPAKFCVFHLFSHMKRDNGIAYLFCIIQQVRKILRFPCFLIRKTTTDLRTCFLLWHKSGKCCVFLLFSHTKDARGLADLFSLKGINLFLNCFKRNKSAQVRVAFCLRGATKTADLLG